MEQVNVNRARRDATSLDNLNRTLEALESQLRSAIEPKEAAPVDAPDIADRFAALASRAGVASAPRPSATAGQRLDGKHDLSAIALQLKQLRDEMRDEIAPAPQNSYEPHGAAMNRLRQSATPEDRLFSRPSESRRETEHLSMLRGDFNELKRTVDKLAQNENGVSRRNEGAPLPTRYMQQIDERLDEISRAIVATSRPAAKYAETDAFERLEARIASLANSVEGNSYDRTSDTILQRMGELAQRVDLLTEQSKRPAINLDALSEQLAAVARHMQNAPAAINISDFRDLEDRVLQIIHKLETMPQQAATDPAFAEQIDQRFAELTQRLDDHHQMSEHSDIRLTDNIEARFDDMARYIALNVPQVEGTHDAIRNLELQIAGLAEHLSQSNERYAEIAAIPPRLDAIELSIASNRDFVVETARHAATEAIRNTANFGNANDSTIARELADDLKTLEALARKSESRNTKTFEAIHDTLLKIVDRLASLESGPVPVYRPSAASATHETIVTQEQSFDAPVFSKIEELSPEVPLAGDAEMPEIEADEKPTLFGNLKRGFKARSRDAAPQEQAPAIDSPVEIDNADAGLDLDPNILNRPLEPGSGMPDLNSILKRVRDDRREMQLSGEASSDKADFIAAARRAAQAAASEVESQKQFSGSVAEEGTKRGLFARTRKPILLAIGAIMIAIAGLQLKSAFLDHPVAPDTTGSISAPFTPEPVKAPEPVASAKEAAPAVASVPATNVEPAQSAATQPAPETVESVIAAQESMPSTLDTSTTQAAPAAAPAAASETLTIPTIPTEFGPEALREAAASGDNKAFFEIGNRYMDGRGVTGDYAKAAEWFNLAAARGFAPAQYRIGNFYEKGLGLGRDLTKAKSFYQLAAEQGNASAMHNLAVLYAGGNDGAPDNVAAARWFTQAAELGVKDSQFNLAILTAKGMGVPQNLEESYKWFAVAANAGDKDAAEKRDDVAKAMTPDQLKRASEATALWKPKQINPDANALDIPDAWREAPMTTGSVDMEKAVRNIQRILTKHGYDAGGSDGHLGAKTRDAIMAFQKDNGLKPTGNIDKDLVRNLLKKAS